MDWDKLRIFHAAAEAGSFTHAGETLNMSQSAVSRQVSALERELRAPLFHRHARGLVLTEQGDLLYRTAQDVFMKLASAEILLSDSRGKPNGDLRITTTVALGIVWLTPRLGEFMNLYPDIRVQLILNDEELDLGMREADVAIRFQPPSQNDLIRRKLFVVHNHVYASPDYVKKHGTPKTIAELERHRILTYGGMAPPHLRRINWLETAGRENGSAARIAGVQINNVIGLLEGVRRGLGLAVLPDYVARDDPKLVAVLDGEDGLPNFETYFVYPEEMKSSKRIEVFRDFMVAKAREWSF
ncbi:MULTISPECIES: LysR family transcriptional regulator [Rhodomicrobium]|uniref:LysR family transcriptional regulator n=1 Tax=Rhodomicrobium TaxID=1068 RepID=UPI000B4B6A59|nr:MULTISPECIES: LysR family transcriptional regulator [Rhodomicrobium]